MHPATVSQVWQIGPMQPPDPNWGTAYPTIAHRVWKTTGSTTVIKRHLSSVALYVDSVSAGVNHTGLAKMLKKYGDWLPPAEAPKASGSLCSAAAFIHDARVVAEMAAAIGESTTAQKYRSLSAETATKFNALWLRNSSYGAGLQTELSLPLWLGIVPKDEVRTVIEALVADIGIHNYHVTSGILGTRATYEALALNGRMDVALEMLRQVSYPSYGYMVENPHEPATTIWENWAASDLTNDQDDSSRNHVMFGSISAFFWKYLNHTAPSMLRV